VKNKHVWLGSRDGAWPHVDVAGEIEAAELEFLHTNGAGAYAMSTIALMHTRRYHGALVAAFDPPLGRHVIVSHADTTLTVEADRRSYRLATHQFPNVAPTPGYRNLVSFAQDPIPRWTFRLGKDLLERTLCLVRGQNAAIMGYTWHGRSPARLSIRPLMPLRPIDKLMTEHGAMTQTLALRPGAVEFQPVPELPPIFFGHEGVFMGSPDWWRRFEYLADRSENPGFQEDMWTPGVFEMELTPERTSYLVAAVGALPTEPPARLVEECRAFLRSQDPGDGARPSVRLLSVAAEQFCLQREQRPVIIAGYPNDVVFTRDLLLSLPGILLARGQMDLAEQTLLNVIDQQRFGLLPEYLAKNGAPRAKPLPDATLWLFEAVRELKRRGGSAELIRRRLYPALIRAFIRIRGGTRRWVWLSSDGLLTNGAHDTPLTWMDAHLGPRPVTPRSGIAIEQQALWARGCRTLAELAREYGHTRLELAAVQAADNARSAFRSRFWCHETDYPYDCVSEARDTADAWADTSIRPNALIALAVDPGLFEDWQARAILERVQAELLTPRGVRSLSPNDSRYIGFFAGTSEEREMAYHQGTGWMHLLGFYVRAALRLSPDDAEQKARLRGLVEQASDQGILLGQLAQLADGDAPHRARGFPAQASSVAELLRSLVWDLAP
jgi:predicted glycogen debranching enzyme